MSNQSANKKALAIRPFSFRRESEENSEPSAVSLGATLSDSLAFKLYELGETEVRPSASVRNFLLQTDDSFALGKLLKVDYILEGSIFSAQNRTRFTAQLLDIPARRVVWAAQFDETEADVFALEDHVSERIARAIEPHLKPLPVEPITDSATVQNTEEVGDEELSIDKNEPDDSIDDETPSKSATRSWLLAAVSVLIFASAFFFLWRSAQTVPNAGHTDAPSIIVLPFQNAGGRAADDSVGTELAETLTANLGGSKKLFVLSANAARDAARGSGSASQIGKDFNVDYVVRGNIRRGADGEIDALAELLETGSGKVLWSDEARSLNGDEIQKRLVEAIFKTLAIEPGSGNEPYKLSRRMPADDSAYEFYLVGRYQMSTRSADGLNKAVTSFARAIEKDEGFALARVGLADAFALQMLYQIPPPADGYEKARASVLRALESDENLPEAHAVLGYVLFYADRDRAASEREFRRAIDLNPSYATAHHWFAITLSAMGRHSEAVEEIELAGRLDPRSVIIASADGMMRFYARDYARAKERYEKAMALDNAFVAAHKIVRWTYEVEKNYRAAAAALEREKSFSGSIDAAGWQILEAQVEAIGSNSEKAMKRLEKVLNDDEVKSNPQSLAYEIALVHALANEPERALDWLEKAESSFNHSFNFVEVDPRFDNIRNNVRYASLVRKLRRQ